MTETMQKGMHPRNRKRRIPFDSNIIENVNIDNIHHGQINKLRKKQTFALKIFEGFLMFK